MEKKRLFTRYLLPLLLALLLIPAASVYTLSAFLPAGWFPVGYYVSAGIALLVNLLPLLFCAGYSSLRLTFLGHGLTVLRAFLYSSVGSVVLQLTAACFLVPDDRKRFLIGAAVCVCVEAVTFWNGIVSVWLTSAGLGIKTRVVGFLLGLVPVANVICLFRIIRTVDFELNTERDRIDRNKARKGDNVCRTKYPILLVHGVFFRDSRLFCYWGRIPKELKKNGAEVYFGNHDSAEPVAVSAAFLAERVRQIVKETGCEKVNIIAHSKGGLDCRCAIANEGIAPLVASLTTVNTPHRGCLFADYLLNKVDKGVQEKVASAYNAAAKKLGDKNPDFLAAVTDLTDEKCKAYDAAWDKPEGIYCHSVGSVLNAPLASPFPLGLTYYLAGHFDGPNDGLVSEPSFAFGDEYTFLEIPGSRGISHADVIDLDRADYPGFDVTEFYVGLVSDLKNRGF